MNPADALPNHSQPANCRWPAGPKQPALLPEQVHIWCADQFSLQPHLATLRARLSTDETARANRFAFEHLRREFAANRGLLRLLLSRYVDAWPGQLQFETNEQGKPALAIPQTTPPVQFNLSHSGQLLLVAITQTHPLGIDVERVRPMPDMHRLAQRFFAPAEARRLQAAPPDQQHLTFFQHWVQKEAYIKAIGLGLSFPTNQFEIAIEPEQPPQLVSIKNNPTAARGWHLTELQPAPDYIGALAIRAESPRISCWQVPLERWLAG